jgi:hypothetical protein
MVHSSVVAVLENGRNTRGLPDQVAGFVLREPSLFSELMFGLWHVEAQIRGLAADAIVKVASQKPALLQPFKAEILGVMGEARPAIVRWHLAQLVPYLKLTKSERTRAVASLREYLEDRSGIVRVCAITSLDEMAEANAALREEVDDLLRGFTRTGTPAVKARARILLKKRKPAA